MILNQIEPAAPGPARPHGRLGTFRAVLLGMVIGAVGLGSFIVPLPLLTLKPGPTPGVSDLVKMTTPVTPAAGSFHITTVCVGDRPNFIDTVRAWLSPKIKVVSRSAIFPPGKTPEEVNREQAALMEDSKGAATAAALKELGYRPEPESVYVLSTQQGSPASRALRAGDIILALDERPITTREQFKEGVTSYRIGEEVSIRVRRGDEVKEFSVETIEAPNGERGRPLVGVVITQRYRFPFEVKLDTRNIGGPSAGLMFALGIVDQLDPADLSHGFVIAGTGTIDEEGNVGEVGAVGQKVIAAQKIGATYFFAPKGDLSEGFDAAPAGMTVLGVEKLHDAVSELRRLALTELPGKSPRSRPRGIQDC